TIRLILALIRPDGGDVRIFGKSVIALRNKALPGVGALIEDPDFYENLSARTNLRMLANLEQVPRHRIDEVLELVGLEDRGEDRVKSYSHGMKQRLGIAQALLSRPDLLVLDEPTSGLDPRGMREVRELIRGLTQSGMTIFLSSHLLYEVEQVCTNLAIINRGKLITAGRLDELIHQTDLFTTEIRAAPVDSAEQVLNEAGFGDGLQVVNGVIKVRARSGQLSDITRALVEKGVDVSAVIPRSSLEDYFLSLTE
ncbi:MAG TPA: ABC transporter ATP-binding protein, partial [bacterium]|nr:ABC transporter ATP-binding protein [bacterium]